MIEFTETVSVLLASGLTFRDALEVAQTIFLKGEINRMVAHLLEQIRKGASVTDAVAGLGDGLPPLYRGFIRIGEKIGSLEEAFKQLAAYLGEDRKVRDKLASSLIYPVLVLGVAVVGIAGIVIFVLPRIQAMFQQLGAALPARLSSALGLLRGAVLGGGLLLAAARWPPCWCSPPCGGRNPALALALDRLVLRLPVYGRVRYLREILNLLFALEMLTAGGFSVEDALARVRGGDRQPGLPRRPRPRPARASCGARTSRPPSSAARCSPAASAAGSPWASGPGRWSRFSGSCGATTRWRSRSGPPVS